MRIQVEQQLPDVGPAGAEDEEARVGPHRRHHGGAPGELERAEAVGRSHSRGGDSAVKRK